MNKLIEKLNQNGFEAYYVETNEEAKQKVYELIPSGSEVMTMSSVTLDDLGISEEINTSGKYNAVKPKLYAKEPDAAYHASNPEFTVGSVHALTENGEVVIASMTGSQLPAYAYGAKNVVWVIGVQKVVKNLDEAMKRVYGEVLTKEDERALKAYGVHSGVNKLLIINKEINPGRIKIVLVNQTLGF